MFSRDFEYTIREFVKLPEDLEIFKESLFGNLDLDINDPQANRLFDIALKKYTGAHAIAHNFKRWVDVYRETEYLT